MGSFSIEPPAASSPVMSAVPPIASEFVCCSETTLGGDLSRCSNEGAEAKLFDYLVGNGKNTRWYCEAERLGGLNIDDEFELGRLLDG
jgi:hypothetical protein